MAQQLFVHEVVQETIKRIYRRRHFKPRLEAVAVKVEALASAFVCRVAKLTLHIFHSPVAFLYIRKQKTHLVVNKDLDIGRASVFDLSP